MSPSLVPPLAAPLPYAHPGGLFSLLVPPGWVASDADVPGAEVIFFCPRLEDGGFRPSINVVAQDLRGLTPDEFLTLTRLQLKQVSGQPRPQRDEPFPGAPGRRLLEWSAPLAGLLLTACQLLVPCGQRAYIVTATVPAASLPRYRDTIQAVFASFTPGATASGPAADFGP